MIKKEKFARHRLDCSLPYIDVPLKSRVLFQQIHGRASRRASRGFTRGAVLMADSSSLTLHHSWPLLLQRVFLSFALSRNPFQYHTTKTEQQTSLWSVFTRTDTRGQADRPHITILGTLQAETPFFLFLIKDGKRGVPSIASCH